VLGLSWDELLIRTCDSVSRKVMQVAKLLPLYPANTANNYANRALVFWINSFGIVVTISLWRDREEV